MISNSVASAKWWSTASSRGSSWPSRSNRCSSRSIVRMLSLNGYSYRTKGRLRRGTPAGRIVSQRRPGRRGLPNHRLFHSCCTWVRSSASGEAVVEQPTASAAARREAVVAPRRPRAGQLLRDDAAHRLGVQPERAITRASGCLLAVDHQHALHRPRASGWIRPAAARRTPPRRGGGRGLPLGLGPIIGCRMASSALGAGSANTRLAHAGAVERAVGRRSRRAEALPHGRHGRSAGGGEGVGDGVGVDQAGAAVAPAARPRCSCRCRCRRSGRCAELSSLDCCVQPSPSSQHPGPSRPASPPAAPARKGPKGTKRPSRRLPLAFITRPTTAPR
jgi:hypothetical protein